MSGGSYNYFHYRLDTFIEDLAKSKHEGPAKLERLAFIKLLQKVSEACYHVEMVDSYDSSPGSEIKPIQDCFLNLDKTISENQIEELKQAISEAQKTLSKLQQTDTKSPN